MAIPDPNLRRLPPPLIGLLLLAAACNGAGEEQRESLPTRFPAADRVVAIGDLHGDLDATRRVLQLAGAIDGQDRWAGGEMVLVQTGDQLDRGGDELEILDLLDRLAEEAERAGGAVHVLNGNHELMNAYLDLRYVTEEGFEDFQEAFPVTEPDSLLLSYEPWERGRVAAFRPGGPVALRLARRNTAVIIGGNLFVHGGILPAQIDRGLDRMNEEIRAWLRGEGPYPEWIRGKTSPVWARNYSDEPDEEDAALLDEVLERLDVHRMVVGHTVQDGGIAAYCDARVWCIDTGMSEHYGGPIRALEIRGDRVRVLRPDDPVPEGGAQEGSQEGSVRQYLARRTSSDLLIDGRLDEEAWKAAPRTEEFVDIRGHDLPEPEWATTARMLWDDEFLYIAAEMEEPHLWATLTERDAIIYRDNDFEVFIDPGGDGRSYYEFEVNALGTMFDLYLDRPYRDGGKAEIAWDADGLRWAVDLQGSLNDPSDRDRGWRVEMAIPWADLTPPGADRPGTRPENGATWRINFSRVQWPLGVEGGAYVRETRADEADGHIEENWVWSPQGEIDMHIPSRWGRVIFMGPDGPGRSR